MSQNDNNMLLEHMQVFLSLYGVHKSFGSLLSDIDFARGTVINAAIVKVWGAKIGVSLSFDKCSFRALAKRRDPCLALLQDGSVVVYTPGDAALETMHGSYAGYIITYHGEAQGAFEGGEKKSAEWFWKPIVSYWKNYAEIIVCSILINCFAIVIPLFSMNVYDKVVPNFAEETLIALTVGALVILGFDFLIKTIRIYIIEGVSTEMSIRFDTELMERFFSLPTQALKMSVGEKANIFRELQTIRDFYASRMVTVFVDLPFFLMFISVIYVLSPALAVVPVIGSAVILAMNLALHIPIRYMTKKHLNDLQSKSSALIELLSGVETVKLFNALPSYLYRWRMISGNSAKSGQRTQFLTETVQNLSLMVLYMVNIAIIFYGVYEIQRGVLTVGGLIACTILSSRAVAPVLSISGIAARLNHAQDVLRAVTKLFHLSQDVDASKSYQDKGKFTGKIEIRDVSFQYNDQSFPALNRVNLMIGAGEKIGLIGQNGAGKTTLAKVLMGEIAPHEGSVLFDEYDAQKIHPYEWRRAIGVVPQNPFFMAGSIRDNVLLGRENLSEEAFERSAVLSGLDLFVSQTGQGYGAQVGENGAYLSGGQKQAIALARALIHDPQIIIFDEPTNGMDHALEMRVMDALRGYLKDKTFIMVTHRTTLLPLVDRLVLLNKGRVIADGARDDVMQKLSGS